MNELLIYISFCGIIFSILGSVLIVMGLYSVLWGKYKEYQEKEVEALILEPVKGSIGNNQSIDIEANDIEMQKNEAHKAVVPVVAINAPIPTPPMIVKEVPKA